MSHRLVILNPEKFKIFHQLSNDKLKLAIKMCNLKIYKPKDEVDMKTGGILFKGSLEIKYKDMLD